MCNFHLIFLQHHLLHHMFKFFTGTSKCCARSPLTQKQENCGTADAMLTSTNYVEGHGNVNNLGILGAWTPPLFSKRTKAPFLKCPLYIKKGTFLRLKKQKPKNFLGTLPPVPISPLLQVKDNAMSFIGLQK